MLSWLSLAPAAPALDPTKAIGQYSLSGWQVDDGLPHSTVYAIAQTPDGYLWLGTGGGLARFDGVRFTLFDRYNTPEIANPHVWSLAVDATGRLWIATNGGGVVELAEGRFRAHGTEAGLRGLRILDVAPSRDGGVWLASYGGGLSLLRDGQVTTWSTGEPGGTDIFSVCETRAGELWVGAHGSGLFRFANGVFQSSASTRALIGTTIWKLLEDRRGDLWIGTDAGLYRLPAARADTALEAFRGPGTIAHDTVLDLFEDRDGNLWIATGGGLSRRAPDGTFSSFGSAGGLESDTLWTVFEDADGNLWLGSSGGGLAQLRDGDFTALDRSHGLASDHVTSVYRDRGGALWVTTHDAGLNRYADGVWTRFTPREGLPHDDLWAVLGDRAGALWLGTNGRGLARMQGGILTTFTTADGLADDTVLALLEGRDGSLWIGTNGGVTRLKDGVWSRFTQAEGLPGNHVRSLYEDQRGDLWIGTAEGLGYWHQGTASQITTRDGLTSNNVWAIYEQPKGTLWLGTAGGGLNRLRGGSIAALTVRQGLPSDSVLSLLPDDQGNLWLCTGQGVMRAPLASLEAVAEGRASRISGVVYGPADGLKTLECQGGSQPAAWSGNDGKLYFATYKGIAVTDPSQLQPSPKAPQAQIEAVLLDGQSQLGAATLDVGPEVDHFEIHYTALSFRAPARLQFRYQLEGFDRTWIEAGSRRTAYYTRLPAGHYRFRVAAREGDGTWGPPSEPIALDVRPRFYETTLFLVLIGAALVAGVALFYRLRLARHERRERELARRVEASLAQIKILSGMLPICASCKKVRDDQGYWSEIETYVSEHSEAELSHSLCPDCVVELYADQLASLGQPNPAEAEERTRR